MIGSHHDLLEEFAGFLTPEQAVECGCYKACMEFLHARAFLRKLEVQWQAKHLFTVIN